VADTAAYDPVTVSGIAVTRGVNTLVGAIPFPIFGQWQYTKRLYLNTTDTGAAVAGTIIDFPVLVRLNVTNFDFSQAQSTGADVRFTQMNSAPLHYEIERWDAAAQQAAIWVLVDTVYGNNSSQYISMYWGNHSVESASSSEAVFDTANSFEAVWHMRSPSAVQTPDATVNGFHGTLYNMTPASTVDGMIGKALSFDGVSSYIDVPGSATGRLDFPEDGTYSLSAWVYLDTLVLTSGYVFISKSDYQYNLEVDREHNYWHMSEYHDGSGLQRIGTPATAREWTQVTGVRNGTDMSLYINGEQVNVTSWTDINPFIQDTSFNVTIGKIGRSLMERFMEGILDEIRISSVSYTPEWIKLCYMNQQSVDKLVVFK
jgi:hypothetical protein